MAKICPKCGKGNLNLAKFCDNCGTALNDIITISGADKESKGTSEGIKGWWNRLSKKGKFVTSCCLGVFLLVVIAGILSPGTTALSFESDNISIDNVTTNIIIKGTSDANATVNITAVDLNITNATIKVGPDGKFEYKLKVPINVTDTKVIISAQNKDKFVRSGEITIQRPLTPFTLNQIPEIDNNTKNVTIEGDTDPQAAITINSNELNIKDIVIHPDSTGHYKHVIQVPLNITDASISAAAVSTGKRTSNLLTINIKRIIPPPAPPQPAPQTPAPAPQVTAPPAQTSSTPQSTGTSSGGSSGYSGSGSGSKSGSSSGSYGSYIGNARSHVLHYSGCYHVDAMKNSNKIYFSSRNAAINAGYRPCKDCNP